MQQKSAQVSCHFEERQTRTRIIFYTSLRFVMFSSNEIKCLEVPGTQINNSKRLQLYFSEASYTVADNSDI